MTRQPLEEHRLIVAGSGGQGVLTLGKLLCMAAMGEGRHVTYLPSYGAEVRSGTAKCQVVVSEGTIYSPLVDQANSLIILNQLSYDRFAPLLRPNGLLLVNGSAVELPDEGLEGRLVSVPAAEVAAEMGDVRVANVILLGAFVAMQGLVKLASCHDALEELMGGRKADLLELNRQALARGAQLAEGHGTP